MTERPSLLIDPAGFDPMDEAFTFEAIRAELGEYVAALRAVAARSEAEDEEEEEEETALDLSDEKAMTLLEDRSEFTADLKVTVEHILLANAFAIYYFNPTFRVEVKATASGDAEEELLARWMDGRVGKGKAQTRTQPKSKMVDRNNFWRSLGTFPDKDKEELTLKVIALFDHISTLELSDGGVEDMSELADRLVTFRDDMYDLQFWALHQGDPSPLLSDEERTGIDLLGIMVSESEDLRFRQMKIGSISPSLQDRLTLLKTELIPKHIRELETMRLESILQLIAEDEAMQLRYTERVEQAQKRNKRRVDSASAGVAELQRIAATDRKKAAARANAYVLYRTLLFRRQIIQQFALQVREEIEGTSVDTDDAEAIAAVAKQRHLLAQLEAEVKSLIEPQRKARIASSAPRLRVESRSKTGRLGPRKARKRVHTESNLPTLEERFSGLSTEATIRIVNVQDSISFLLLRRDEPAAAALVVRVVQLLAPLTGLDGSVTRENLSTEAVRKRTDGSIALTASQWGGRQDIDLVLLFTQHRQHFEQLAQILREWRKKRISETNRPPPPPDPKACTEQGCALRATDRAAAKAQDSPVE